MGLPLLATAAIAGAQIYEGMAAKAEAETQADYAKYNAAVLENEAKAEEQAGRIRSQRQAEEAARIQASLEAGLGASGAVMGVGSPLAILGEQARQSDIENAMIGYETAIEASRRRSAARGELYKAKAYKQQGRAAMTASIIKAGSSLLTGFASRKPSDYELAKKHGILSAYTG